MIEGDGFTIDVGGNAAPDYTEGRPAHDNTDHCPACAQMNNLRAWVKERGLFPDIDAARVRVNTKLSRLLWYGADQRIAAGLLTLAQKHAAGEAIPDMMEQMLNLLGAVLSEADAIEITEEWRLQMLKENPWSGGETWQIKA